MSQEQVVGQCMKCGQAIPSCMCNPYGATPQLVSNEQILALNAEIERLTAERDESLEDFSVLLNKCAELEPERDSLKRHLDAIAATLGLPYHICVCGHSREAHDGHTQVPGQLTPDHCACCPLGACHHWRPTTYLPDQLPEMVTTLKRENAALKAALDAYRMIFTKSELEERVRIFNAYRPIATASPAETAAPSEGGKFEEGS